MNVWISACTLFVFRGNKKGPRNDQVLLLRPSHFVCVWKTNLLTVSSSALHLAACAGHSDVVEYLCHQCPRLINGQDDVGATPLMRAVRCGSGPCVEKLLDSDCDVSVADHTGNTALHRCAQQNDQSMAAMAINHGAAMDAVDKAGNTPLHAAVMAGSMETSDLLLSRGCSPDKLNESSMTPLMIAANENRVMLIKNALLKYPVNILMTNQEGLKASDIALVNGHHGLHDLIANHEINPTSPVHSKSPRSPMAQASGGPGPPPLRPIRTQSPQESSEPIGRNPNTLDLDISEAVDETASQASGNINSWGSENSDAEMQTLTQPEEPTQPQSSRTGSVRQQPAAGGAAGRHSPWTTLSPPAGQGDESESSDGVAKAIPVRQSRTRIPSSVTTSRPQSPSVDSAAAIGQIDTKIPRPKPGAPLPPLSTKHSASDLRSGSKIPLPASSPIGTGSGFAGEPSPLDKSSPSRAAGVHGAATAAGATAGAGRDMFDGGMGAAEEDDDWNTESSVSGLHDDATGDAGLFSPARGSPRSKAASPRSVEDVPKANPSLEQQQPVNVQTDEVESDSDFTLDEEEEEDSGEQHLAAV
eukprot:scpid71703/ scgid1004/ Ankyrin repeat domain-containing protein 30B; Serologically defined breast cancer antigen NY-BR-1.1